MISPPSTIVRFSLALHLGIEPNAISGSASLEDDLGLDPLDVVLVALRLEEMEGVGFPIGDLARVRTVDDLVDLVAAWAGVPDEPNRKDSEVRLAASAARPERPRRAAARGL